MIISETVSSPVITSLSATPSRFKIKASAKAFKILSGFYSEPILAIPRELGANAWDSHVKAGNTDKMFEVHAPNNLEPWFSVRDFGTGLSPVDVETIYTTYFESTKTHENDSDGCMGLGSKTPFNYTDNFNVTSFFGGKKYVYNCFIDEAGSPNLIPVAVEDSDQPNGLEVKMGVKISDIAMWQTLITRAYEPFRFRPIIKGATIDFPAREYLYEGKGWGYRKPDGYHNRRECMAFMGNYCYPILYRSMSTVPDYSNLHARTVFCEGGIDFFFDIGGLEVAPNKEQLQYEDGNTTVTNLVAAAERAFAELKEMVIANVDVVKTRWEAMAVYKKYNETSSDRIAVIRNLIGEVPVKFNGKGIRASHVKVDAVHSATSTSALGTLIKPYQLYVVDRVSYRCRKTGSYHSPTDHNNVIIFYTNSRSIKIARLRHYLKTTYPATGTKAMPPCFVITDESPENKDFFAHKTYFGWEDSVVHNIDALPKCPTAPRAKKTVNTDEIYYSDITAYSTAGETNLYFQWHKKSEVFLATDTYYYVDFCYNSPMWGERNVVDLIMGCAVKFLVHNKLIDGVENIYGISRKNVNLLKVGKWINVIDVVYKHINANIAEHEDQFFLENYKKDVKLFGDPYARKVGCTHTFFKCLVNPDTKKLFKLIMSVAERANGKVNGSRFDDEFYKFFNVSPKQHSPVELVIEDAQKILNEKYMGILDIAREYTSGSDLAKIVNFIDEKSQKALTI